MGAAHISGAIMGNGDLYVQAVEAIYACGTGEVKVADALTGVSRLLGASGATYEVIDKASGGLLWFTSAGLPHAAAPRYADHFAALNPRISPILRLKPGEVNWDCKLMDEEAMKRDAFYSEFVPSMGLRYFVSAVLEQTEERIAVIAVQRSPRKGPVTDREIALLRRDGGIVFVNEALQHLAARNRDFRIDRNTVEFATPDLRSRFAAALGAVQRIHHPDAAFLATDFAVPREGLPPYTVSVRPLLRMGEETTHADVAAMLLVHDPLQQNLAAGKMLQELNGLTNAEAQLVQALGSGMTAVAYAKSRNISVTTVYTHLRRTREKTGWKSVAELTRRFHELNVSLRPN
jgi:DNA-binding CsgD family transcriptional regulator